MKRPVVRGCTLLCAVLTILMLVAGPAQAGQNPVAAYGFNEGTGTAVNDASGTGNHGTTASTSWAPMGKFGSALNFTTGTSQVTVPDSNSLDLTTGITLEAWVNPSGLAGTWRTVVFKQTGSGMAYSLYAANDSNRPLGQVEIGGERNVIGTAALPLNTWTHLAATYDGATQRLFVNGAQVASRSQTGSAVVSTGVLRIGGNSIWPAERYRGMIDEVRVYDRALSTAEVQADMNTPVAAPVADTQPPTAPTALTQTAATETTATVSWTASTDNVAVAGYGLYRAGSPAGTAGTTTATFGGLTCGASQPIAVDAYDAAGNRSGQATLTVTTTACDTSPPAVQLTNPAAGPVGGTVTVAAIASDDRTVAGVRFRLDGADLGSEDTSAPYQVQWDTTQSSSGNHTLTAVARDGAGNTTTSAPVQVTVANSTANFVNDRVVIGLDEPTDLTWTPDGRMLLTERDGTVWVVQPGASSVDPLPLIQLPSVSVDNERGLLGVAVDPAFAENGFIYLFYTHGSLRNRVSRFVVSGGVAAPASEHVVWENPVASDVWHQGGDLDFGPDGYLYISVGDHLRGQTVQDLDSYHGKILRVAGDGTVPADNPFYDGAGPNLDAIWIRGLRNPFRFSIDDVTGRMLIGDVGEGTTEEVNLGVKGANYGWPACEGSCGVAGMTNPIYSYPHNNHDASVTGGFVYRGTQFPEEYRGDYFFADYGMNWIKRLSLDADGRVTAVRNFEPPDGQMDGPYGEIVALAEGPDGSLWYIDAGPFELGNAGSVRRIRNTNANQPPSAHAAGTPLSGPAPLEVSFSSAGSADPEGQPLTYRWDFGDGTSSTAADPTHTYGESGRYTARLTTSDGNGDAISSPLTITVGSPPSATILQPTNGQTFRAGDVITFSGEGNDPDDGALTGSSLSWKIVFHHDGHIHPVLDGATGPSGTLTVPTSGHSFNGSTSYEIVLTATDDDGIQATASVTVDPEKVPVSLATSPSGLNLLLDGISRTTPFSQSEVVGFRYAVDAPSPQTLGSTRYAFGSWSDAGAKAHSVTVPPAGLDLTATFAPDTSAPPGLVAAYNFNDGSGNTLIDRTGHGLNGTLTGPTWTAAGRNGGALSFDGVNDSVRVNDHNDLDLRTGMTVEAWVRPTALGNGWRTVVFKEQPGHMTYALYAGTDTGRPTGQAYVGGERDARGPSGIPLNTWTHLATSYDGSTVRLYVNGSEVRALGANGSMAVSTGPLKLGGNAIFGSEWFAGAMDDVRIYNRALTPAEIQGDMGTPVTGP
jgi:glucose/arabinose dehydrogenase